MNGVLPNSHVRKKKLGNYFQVPVMKNKLRLNFKAIKTSWSGSARRTPVGGVGGGVGQEKREEKPAQSDTLRFKDDSC